MKPLTVLTRYSPAVEAHQAGPYAVMDTDPDGEYVHIDAYQEATDRIAELEAKLAEAEKDAERLESLVRAEARVAFSKDGDDCWVILGYDEDIPSLGPIYHDWRKAIDAVFAQREGKE